MNKAKHFRHDANAHNDVKITCLINDYGLEGYGRFWVIVETLMNCKDYALNFSNHVSKGLTIKLKMENIEELKKFLEYLCSIDLLSTDGNVFVSPRLCSDMEQYEQWISTQKENAKTRWKKVKDQTDEGVREIINTWNDLAELKPDRYKKARPYSADLNNLLHGRLSKPRFKEEILQIISFLSINNAPLDFTFVELISSENIFNSILEISGG